MNKVFFLFIFIPALASARIDLNANHVWEGAFSPWLDPITKEIDSLEVEKKDPSLLDRMAGRTRQSLNPKQRVRIGNALMDPFLRMIRKKIEVYKSNLRCQGEASEIFTRRPLTSEEMIRVLDFAYKDSFDESGGFAIYGLSSQYTPDFTEAVVNYKTGSVYNTIVRDGVIVRLQYRLVMVPPLAAHQMGVTYNKYFIDCRDEDSSLGTNF